MKKTESEILEQLIHTKSFDQLTSEERVIVLEHFSSSRSYNRLFELLTTTKNESQRAVSKAVKRNLIADFKAKHEPKPLAWLSYQSPVYLDVMIIAVFTLSIWLIMPVKEVIVERPVTVQLPGKVDTLLIQLPADTVYIKKYIEVEVPIYITERVVETKPIPGSNMADKRELNDLFVSSSGVP